MHKLVLFCFVLSLHSTYLFRTLITHHNRNSSQKRTSRKTAKNGPIKSLPRLACWFMIAFFLRLLYPGPVAQWITRLPTEQKIAGSIPAWIVSFYLFLRQLVEAISFVNVNSSVVSSAPTFLRTRVRIPSTPTMLFSICIIEIVSRK